MDRVIKKGVGLLFLSLALGVCLVKGFYGSGCKFRIRNLYFEQGPKLHYS